MMHATFSLEPYCPGLHRTNDTDLHELIPLPVIQTIVNNAAQYRLDIPVNNVGAFDCLVSFCQGGNVHEAAIAYHVPISVAIKNIRRLAILGADATVALLKRGKRQKAVIENIHESQDTYCPPFAIAKAAANPNISEREKTRTCISSEHVPSLPPPCPRAPSENARPTSLSPPRAPVILAPAQADAAFVDFANTYINPDELVFEPDWPQWLPQAQMSNLDSTCATNESEASINSSFSPLSQNPMMPFAPSPEPAATTSWPSFNGMDGHTPNSWWSFAGGEYLDYVNTTHRMAEVGPSQTKPTLAKRARQRASRAKELARQPFVEDAKFKTAIWPEPDKMTNGHRPTAEQRAYFAAYARAHAQFVPSHAQANIDALIAICEGVTKIAASAAHGLARDTLATRLRQLSRIGPKALFQSLIMEAPRVAK